MISTLSTDKILQTVVGIVTRHVSAGAPIELLDIGSGTGALIAALRTAHPCIKTRACDYTASLMTLPDQPVDVVDLSRDGLPYEDACFDVVTCTEVVEHLENYRRVVRETYRVVKPGGLVVFTTPNVLNLQSRIRYLCFGFWNLFGPLPIGRRENFSTAGHITPVPYFYLAHALVEAGFDPPRFTIDKVQRSALPKLILLWPLIAIYSALAIHRERRKYRTIDAGNEGMVREMNRLDMLLGRTLVVFAHRPAA